jgi:hypothetical protein
MVSLFPSLSPQYWSMRFFFFVFIFFFVDSYFASSKSNSIFSGSSYLGRSLIQVDIEDHPPIPTGSSCQFLVQHVLLYFFVIVGYTLTGLCESLHIF